MTEELNMHFSLLVTLPVPETKLNGPEGNVGAVSCNPRSSR